MVDNIQKTCDELGKINMLGVPIESASAKFLITSDENFSDHVLMHPALITFYGAKKKEAERAKNKVVRQYDRFTKEKFAEAKTLMLKTPEWDKKKPTISDVESFSLKTFGKEHEDFVDKIEEAQRVYDLYEVYYEGLKQKSFSIREHAGMIQDEFYIKDNIKDDIRNANSGIDIIRKHQGDK